MSFILRRRGIYGGSKKIKQAVFSWGLIDLKKTAIRMASSMEGNTEVTLKDVQDASVRIAPFINRTPVMTCGTLDKMAGKSLYFKCEIFQKVGAFKFRGAMNAVLNITENCSEAELPVVVTHSSGNHGQALALAAKVKGLKAHIVMPNNAPAIKKAAVKDYGANIVECEISQQDREAAAARVLKETGPNSYLVPPYDNKHIIAGQGTMALELLEQVPDLDAIVVPVGGGGMLSGICVAAKGIKPSIKIFAAEPLLADDCAKSFAAGKRIPLPGPPATVADGLKTSLGFITWPIIRDNIDDVITVTESEIISTMRLVWERMKLVIEPSAAVAVAAVLSERFRGENKNVEKVAVILCGGNVNLDSLPWNK
ncbi:serine racemase-like [Actinia tenebrosa]|uniref:L-serine ammonia-lyase n=1 Tax=Actinia tenebrosa TaxID=6105 RepID=A0A6P8ITW0_ACTTE|nr:serine racemase-like [Actinia tenebrosa]